MISIIILLWLLNSSTIFSSRINGCHMIPSNFSLCFGIGYTHMYSPNLLNHENLNEIFSELSLWKSLVNLKCHPNIRLFFCTILAPVCLKQKSEKINLILSSKYENYNFNSITTNQNLKFFYPCRKLCQSVKQSCESLMIKQLKYQWPTTINCNQYPEESQYCVSNYFSTTTATMTTIPAPPLRP